MSKGIWHGGFPGEHEASTLETIKDNRENPGLDVFFGAAKKLVHNWRGNKFVGLYLHGTSGTGKTHAAIGLGKALQEQGADIFYRFGPDLGGVLRWYWPMDRASHEHE